MTRKNYMNAAIVSLENNKIYNYYKKTVLKKIPIYVLEKDVPKKIERKNTVSIWGLNPTSENESIWRLLKSGDIIFFFRKGKIISKSTVLTITKNLNIPKKFWHDETYGKNRSLIIFLDKISELDLDVKYAMRYFLEKPMILEKYNFPIVKINDEKLRLMIRIFGSVDNALKSIKELEVNDEQKKSYTSLSNVDVKIVDKISKIRIGQNKFRKKVLENFNHKCAICQINDNNLLEASHIVPVSNKKLSGFIKNGICLCVLHHKMFDQGYFTINQSLKVVLNKNIQIDKILLSSTKEGKKISHSTIPPDIHLFKIHQMRFLI